MSDLKNNASREEMMRYLFAELSENDREDFEQRMFEDDELFFSVADLENEMVDSYVKGELSGAEMSMFESSLKKYPARQEKIANARALVDYLESERPLAVAAEPKASLTERLTAAFSLRTPAFSYAMTGLVLLLGISSVLLFLDGRQKSNEIARLQDQTTSNKNDLETKIKQLESQIADTSQRETEIGRQLDNEREASGDLTDELNTERQRREQMEAELERLRRESKIPMQTPKKDPGDQTPTITSIKIKPGLNGGEQTTSVGNKTTRLVVNIALPDSVKKDDRLSVNLNGKLYLNSVLPRVSTDGHKSLNLTIQRNDLLIGDNKLVVLDTNGKEIARSAFKVTNE